MDLKQCGGKDGTQYGLVEYDFIKKYIGIKFIYSKLLLQLKTRKGDGVIDDLM